MIELNRQLHTMISCVRKVVLRQYILPYIGAAQIILGVVLFYMSPISFIMLAVTTYKVAIAPWAIVHVPWFNLWIFLGMMPIFLVLGLIFVFKFILPSIYDFGNKQGYKHGNPFVTDLQEILRRLDRIEKNQGGKK